MWINLPKDQVERFAKWVETYGSGPEDASLVKEMREKVESAFDPMNGHYVESAKERYQRDGEVEVDEQSDNSALVSFSDDGGAYVLAWVWVYDDDVPEGRRDDDEEKAA